MGVIRKSNKELKTEFDGVYDKYKLIIEHYPSICLMKNNKVQCFIDVRDWKKIKNSIDELLNKEME